MQEEIIGFLSVSFHLIDYILVFTSNRIIAREKTPKYVGDALDALANIIRNVTYLETLKSRSPEDILKESRWNFAIPYNEIEKVEIKKDRASRVLIDIGLKKEAETKVLTYAQFGWIPWKRPRLLPASQVSTLIKFIGSCNCIREHTCFPKAVEICRNILRPVIGDKLSVKK